MHLFLLPLNFHPLDSLAISSDSRHEEITTLDEYKVITS